MVALAFAFAFALGACGSATPLPQGFPIGDSWTVPLVGPLEDGLLLVPALVGGKGPYLFAIDPDAKLSIIDEQVAADAGLKAARMQDIYDETDTAQPEAYVKVPTWTLGTLTVQGHPAVVIKKGAFDRDGRQVHGVIGRDIINDALVLGFDRELGELSLASARAFHPPPGAIALADTPLTSTIVANTEVEIVPPPRRLVDATIGAAQLRMHLDLGATESQLRSGLWTNAKLAPAEAHATLLDEAGTSRVVDQSGVAATVAVGAAKVTNVVFVKYTDQRWDVGDLDGTLGLDFFRPFAVWASWARETFYVMPRRDREATIAQRIARWKALAGCAHVGCATAELVDPLAGKPADEIPAQHPGVIVSVTRDPELAKTDLEVLFEVTSPSGARLQWLVANLPAGAERALTHLPSDYLGATLTAIDASPFPRPCPDEAGCVDRITAPAP